MSKAPTIVAYLGKGGSGKSALSALTAKLCIKRSLKVLLIDADPAMGLATALAIDDVKTVGQAREEIIRQARIVTKEEEKQRLPEIIDYLLLAALTERPQYSMLVMGQTDTVGCFCPVNSLLRDTIDTIAHGFDVVIIDAEAGIEQINRQVTRSVRFALLLSDNSARGVKTTLLAADTINRSPAAQPEVVGVVFNRVQEPFPQLVTTLSEGQLRVCGVVPVDEEVAARDAQGLSLLDLPETSVALGALDGILKDLGVY